MPTTRPSSDPRLAAAEARFHAVASDLERASLDMVDRSQPVTEADIELTREERIGRAVANAIGRYREAHRVQ